MLSCSGGHKPVPSDIQLISCPQLSLHGWRGPVRVCVRNSPAVSPERLPFRRWQVNHEQGQRQRHLERSREWCCWSSRRGLQAALRQSAHVGKESRGALDVGAGAITEVGGQCVALVHETHRSVECDSIFCQCTGAGRAVAEYLRPRELEREAMARPRRSRETLLGGTTDAIQVAEAGGMKVRASPQTQ